MKNRLFIVTLFSILLLSGCAGQQRETKELASLLQHQHPQSILNSLEATDPPERDFAQFYLNLGFLQLLVGDFSASVTTLSKAKKEMASLEALSISENVAAGTINETLRAYSGYPVDRVMVHNMLALSYLFNDDIDSARVEVLQADIAMKKLYKKGSFNGQLATSHLIAGMIYELLNEQSNALISYKHSESILDKRGLSIPQSLKQALLRLSYSVDRKGQYVSYKKRYRGFTTPSKRNKKQVFVLYFDGVISNKVEKSILVPSGNEEQLIRISVPAYPTKNYQRSHAQLLQTQQAVTTELIDNLEVSVREDLTREYPSILLLTTARAIAKYEMVEEATKKDSLFGLLVNLATVLSEIADLRSWNMLPSNIQFAYIETAENEFVIDNSQHPQESVDLTEGHKHVLLLSSLPSDILHYQQ